MHKKMRNPVGLRKGSTKGGGFGGHAPTPVEDAQRDAIITQKQRPCKRFVLLCNMSWMAQSQQLF
jgi:hypothetical protein